MLDVGADGGQEYVGADGGRFDGIPLHEEEGGGV